LASALFTGRNADFPGCIGQSRICSVWAERSLLHAIKDVKSWMERLDAPVRGARSGEELIRHLPVHPALSEALPFKKASRKDPALSAASPFQIRVPSLEYAKRSV